MAYAVVCFIDNTVSEVPTNWIHEDDNEVMCWWPPTSVKNVSTLISKRADPDKKSWSLISVKIQKYFASVEKARKAAEDDNYTSTDDQRMGKGQRKKKPIHVNHSDTDENEERNNDKKNRRSSSKNMKVYGRKKVNVPINKEQSEDDLTGNEQNIDKALPAWPTDLEIQSSQNNANIGVKSVTNNNQNDVMQTTGRELVREHSEMSASKSESSGSKRTWNTNKSTENNTVLNFLERIDENVENLMRAVADMHLELDDVSAQLTNKYIRNGQNKSNTERIKTFLPLKCVDDIKKIEAELKNDKTLYNEYEAFLQKIGGHSPREHVRNILAKVFSNECAMKCSWKGRRQNFAVSKLLVITVMKDVILGHHVVTEKDLDTISAEWFRFAKQRKNREEKEN
ncbi:uncharacterized protein [Temnothorax nylanderi]|uniref:uncharacterized protein n=1 Tax=Temnothorax nylanderi TaxID=102681 RepID=UPI003A84E49F